MMGVVVLSSDFEPLGVVSLKKAIAYLLTGKGEVYEATDDGRVITATSFSTPVPKAIKLAKSITLPHNSHEMNWSRKVMLERDCYTCGYCGEKGMTVDHINPQSRGGKNTWMNTIACCFKCNNVKADRTPEEAGMSLLFEPKPVLRVENLMMTIAATGFSIEAAKQMVAV